MPSYQEGHDGTVDKNVGVLKHPNHSFCFSFCFIGQIRLGQIFPSGSSIVPLFSDRICLTPGRTHLTYQTYLNLHQVSVP
jgi:hypothetical protein